MAEKTKTGNVGTCGYMIPFCHPLCNPVQGCHNHLRFFHCGRRSHLCLDGSINDAASDLLCQYQHISRPASVIFENLIRMYKTGHTQPVFRLVILHGMPSYKDRTCFFYFVCAPCKDISQDRRVQTIRKSDNIQRNCRFSSHGPHIAQRIGRCNLSEHIRIIYNRRKKVYCLDHGYIVCYLIYCCIVGSLDSNQQIIILEFWQLAQNLSKGLRTNFSRSSGCFA